MSQTLTDRQELPLLDAQSHLMTGRALRPGGHGERGSEGEAGLRETPTGSCRPSTPTTSEHTPGAARRRFLTQPSR